MATVELKTKARTASVEKFLKTVKDPAVRADCDQIMKIMAAATKSEAVMWGTAIVGFGSSHWVGKNGREVDWFLTGFAPRKGNLSVYIMSGFDAHGDLMAKLGKHKTGKSCLYIKQLDDVHVPTLRKLVTESVKQMKKTHAATGSSTKKVVKKKVTKKKAVRKKTTKTKAATKKSRRKSGVKARGRR